MSMIRRLLPFLLLASVGSAQEAAPPPTPAPAASQVQKPSDPKHAADLDRDATMGKRYAEEVDKERKLSENPEYIARVQAIAAQLAPIAQRERVEVTWGDGRLNPFEYTFKVLKDDDVNAFSLPGGYIYVNEGLIEFCQSDDELAAVMAHEIAHASLRHVATLEREANKLSLVTLPLVLVGLFTGHPEIMTLGNLVGIASGSGWSVRAEQAADWAGFQYLRRSSYNPVGMLTFMERLARQQRHIEGVDLGIFQTHPPSKQRAEAVTSKLRDAGLPIHRSQVSESYRVLLKDVPSGVELWFDGRKLMTLGGPEAKPRADEAARKLNAFFDEVPQIYEVRAQRPGSIYGSGQTLVTLTEADAAAAGAGLDAYLDQSADRVRGTLYTLAYRVWDLGR